MARNSKDEVWKKLIQEMGNCGKSQKKWCEEKGINFSTLKYWMKKLSSKTKPLDGQVVDKETRWLKVNMMPETDFKPQITDKIEICIGNLRVYVPENFSKQSMVSILKVLTEL